MDAWEALDGREIPQEERINYQNQTNRAIQKAHTTKH